MKHSTVGILQTIVAMLAIIANIGLQITGSIALGKATTDNPDIATAKRILTGSIITQILAVILIGSVLSVIVFAKDAFSGGTSVWIYIALVTAGILLLIGGSLGATVAMKLQCYRSDPNVQKAWQMSTISAVIGIVGAMLMLVVQGFLKREEIKVRVLKQLAPRKPNPPTPKPMQVNPNAMPRTRRAPMPTHHPAPFKRGSF